mgnify:CR=1 FL=1
MSQPLGDITPEEFQDAAGFLTDWLSSYLSKDSYPEPVLSQVEPGELLKTQPKEPPLKGQNPREVLEEFERGLVWAEMKACLLERLELIRSELELPDDLKPEGASTVKELQIEAQSVRYMMQLPEILRLSPEEMGVILKEDDDG